MDDSMRARVVVEMGRLGWFHDDDSTEVREHMAEHTMVGAWVGLRLALRDVWVAIRDNILPPWF
jgi:hypothetical protein